MNYQPSQPTSTIPWSAFPENLLQHTSQQYPTSLHRTAPHQFSSPGTSLSLQQISCSVMHLQSPTLPQSPLNTCQSLEPLATESEAPTNHPWQIVKKRKRTHPQWRRLHEDISPHLTHQINLKYSRIFPMTTSQHLHSLLT